jgi:hypothetical protein
MSRRRHLLFILTTLALPGCGTFMNITSPPPKMAEPSMFICESECVPFGGTIRSGLLGLACTEGGAGGLLFGGNSQDGGRLGAARTLGLGLGALIDTPLSFAGDVITFPAALARCQNQSWASWWGDKGWDGPRPKAPADPVPLMSDDKQCSPTNVSDPVVPQPRRGGTP